MSDKELERIKMEKAKKLLEQLSMPKTIIEINNFDQYRDLINKYPNKVIIIDFWATWCAPCKMFAPIFERLHQEYSTQFIFIKINVDNNQIIANQYGITGIPTTLFVISGNVMSKIVGATNYDKMKQVIESFL